MVKSTTVAGTVAERALNRTGMLAIAKYGISMDNVLKLTNLSVREVAAKYFETEKEAYYDSRIILGKNNGKFCASGASWSQNTKALAVTMNPLATSSDIGKAITFFDGNSTPNQFFSGIISGFASPSTYYVNLFYQVTDLSNVVNVTVGYWLLDGTSIQLNDENQIFVPDKMALYDSLNNSTLDIVDYHEFEYRKTLNEYSNGGTAWCRYRKNMIDVFVGAAYPPLGTLVLSAYFEPDSAGDFDAQLSISEIHIGEVEDTLVNRLMAIKNHTAYNADLLQGRLAAQQIKTSETVADEQKER